MHVSGTALSLSVCMSNRQQKSPLNADGSAHGLPEVWRGYHAANRALFWSRGASPAGIETFATRLEDRGRGSGSMGNAVEYFYLFSAFSTYCLLRTINCDHAIVLFCDELTFFPLTDLGERQM